MAFARGLEVSLVFDDDVPATATLAAVLDRVLARHADVNSFVQTVLLRPDGRERARWPARSGTRTLL
jgi:type VI secretion system protein ImpG